MYTHNRVVSPVVVFCFKRVDELRQTIEKLSANYLATETILYIFSDGPRKDIEVAQVNSVRSYLKSISGFKRVVITEHPNNLGLAKSVISGVSAVLRDHRKVIIVEDDLITSPNFLDFMNQALDYYEYNNKVLSVSGFTLPLNNMPAGSDFYTGYRSSSWAWATWEHKWINIDWSISDFQEFILDVKAKREFNRGGSDMSKMLKDQITGKIDSWAIRYCYHQFRNDMVTVFPTVSKAASIGFGAGATHTLNESRFKTNLDIGQQREFVFNDCVAVDELLAKEFRKFFSLKVRIAGRLIKYLTKLKLV